MPQEMLIVGKEDINANQLCYYLDMIDKQIDNKKHVAKAKYEMAQALCKLNTVNELDEVVSHFICKVVPIFRNNMTAWYTIRKEILEKLK